MDFLFTLLLERFATAFLMTAFLPPLGNEPLMAAPGVVTQSLHTLGQHHCPSPPAEHSAKA
jgi:hypothetical protein